MPKRPEPGEPARYRYQTVKYSEFEVKPGISLVLTAEPWAYLAAWLSQKISKSRGPGRTRYERAKYFAGLARDFYSSAESVDLPAKGTLLYYGILNLAKCFVSTKGIELGQGWETHGLTLEPGTTPSLSITPKPKLATSIFCELAQSLGASVAGKRTMLLTDLLSQIPEIHEIAFTLGKLPIIDC